MDLRERIVAAVDAGMTQGQAAERFGVSLRTVERYVARRRVTGSLAPTEQRHGPEPKQRRQLQAWLPGRLDAAADATLAEHSRGDTRETRRVRPDTATRILGIGMNDASRAPHSRVDATGTRRRLHALIAIGWPGELLAAQLGRRPNSLHRSMTGESVTARTAHDVATLYERLWSTRPPRGTRDQRAAAAARAHASAQGWLPPLAWDDIDTDPTPTPPTSRLPRGNDIDGIAVQRALAGDNITYDDLTPVEQQEVIRLLSARGTSIRDIAARLGTTKRTVSRRRASRGAA